MDVTNSDHRLGNSQTGPGRRFLVDLQHLKIYLDLGYDVTFIPSDLHYLGEYTEALHQLGVRCLQRTEIDSVQQHLQKEGGQYDFVILCRAPIAALYIADIRQYAPNAKILLDTIDLHYLREMREAQLDGSPQKLKSGRRCKEMGTRHHSSM